VTNDDLNLLTDYVANPDNYKNSDGSVMKIGQLLASNTAKIIQNTNTAIALHVGDIVNKPVPSLNLKKLTVKLAKVAANEAGRKLLSAPSNNARKSIKKVTAMYDSETGAIVTGGNGSRTKETLKRSVQKKLPEESKELWPCTQCAEVDALNNAANSNMKLGKNIFSFTYHIDHKTNTLIPVGPCKNCTITLKGTNVLSTSKPK
jgi:hypothetical protein